MSEPPRGVDFDRLNKDFYSSNPAEYFMDRLHLLALKAGSPDALEDLLVDGVLIDSLRIKVQSGITSTGDAASDRRRTAFLITESQTLLHQASEALVRLYLGHAGGPSCPWLECAALLSFSQLRDELDRLASSVWTQEMLDDAAMIFIGGIPDDPSEDWKRARDATVRLLRVVASRLSNDKNLYNSVKHGMTIIPSETHVSVSDGDTGRSFVAGRGPSVTFLERENEDKQRVWYQTTKWFSHENAMWLTTMVISQIEALWTIARARYTDGPMPRGIGVVTDEAIDMLGSQLRPEGSITQWRMKVAVQSSPK